MGLTIRQKTKKNAYNNTSVILTLIFFLISLKNELNGLHYNFTVAQPLVNLKVGKDEESIHSRHLLKNISLSFLEFSVSKPLFNVS